ncbi:TraB/GumN family protein [Vibrio sp. TH_r3]|uniref:TraB/GumN family protein n=1 Tax=Vibrio sp. TH_r3 TaxID=3082084 RepID=UPI0029530A17|nr:TraB/GumN family protein [Vibrio sp. TH_r3]MDV7104087.1 TraB/GumN family protein [Vibrio sp. TH_r3]
MNTAVTTSITLLSLLLSYTVAAEPLFFQAKKGDKQLMILGSIHIGHPKMYPLPEAIHNFLQSSDAIITEMKLTDGIPTIPTDAILTNQVLDKQQLLKLEEINQQLNFNPKAFVNKPAWQTAMTLQISQFIKMGFSQELGTDHYITEQATLLDKPILGLESAQFQLSLFTDDPKTGELMLTDTIDNWTEHQEVSQCLAQNWQAGNKEKLAEFLLQNSLNEALNDEFIYKRNHAWANKLTSNSFISDGKYLVVVGALHLVGKDNLINLLSEKGFEIIQLSQEQPLDC